MTNDTPQSPVILPKSEPLTPEEAMQLTSPVAPVTAPPLDTTMPEANPENYVQNNTNTPLEQKLKEIQEQRTQQSDSIDDAFNKQVEAQNLVADAEVKSANAQAELLNQESIDIDNAITSQQTKEANRQKALNSSLEKFNTISKQLATAKIDPDRYWNSQTTMQKIGAGIAIMLGAIGAGLQGSKENHALNIIDNAIARDIDAQKANIGKLKGQADVQKTLYGLMLQQYGDERAAESASRALLLDQTKLKLQKLAATTKSETAKANALNAEGKLEIMKQEELNKLGLAVSAAALPVGTGDKIPEGFDRFLSEKDRKRWVPGWGIAKSEKIANSFSTDATDLEDGIETIDTIFQILDDSTFGRLNPITRAKVQSHARNLLAKSRKAITGGGNMAVQEYKIIEQAVGDPSKILVFPGTQIVKMKEARQNMIKSLNSKAKIAGLEPRNYVKSFEPESK